ncbi:MAG: 3-keto-disaccharide hydrolase [Candidatus Oleimicrobiaceae bacterium]
MNPYRLACVMYAIGILLFVGCGGEQWQTLFDGRSVEAWRGFHRPDFPSAGWTVQEGALKTIVGGEHVDLLTKQIYRNFELQLEWKVAPGGNSGIFYRVNEEADAVWQSAPEMQVLDDQRHPDGRDARTSAGALYGLIAPLGKRLRPAGQYNKVRILVQGTTVEHWLNGVKVVAYDLASDSLRGLIAASKFKDYPWFALARQGYIALQHHGEEVWYRNIKIRPLPDEPNVPPEGFVALFNGTDLTGWKGLVGNPLSRAQMSSEELALAQAAADDTMRAHWRVRDGILEFDGKGSHLCTARDYEDFQLLVDWKIEPDGDSGIYLRGCPQVQIWDATKHPEGSGGLYNNQIHPNKPLVRADRPAGRWNSFAITMVGERVTVRLNDVLVVDNVVMENYWDRSLPVFSSGQIELQSHGTRLYFRNIYIREIPRPGEWRALFNGTDLSGWIGATDVYYVRNGAIVCPKGAYANLYTEQEFADFVLRFEFRLTPGANNGLAIRTPLSGDPAYAGMEIQILDDNHRDYAHIKPYQCHGSVYGVAPAKRGYLRPPGEWNVEEVTAQGSLVTVVLNGTTILETDLKEAIERGTADGQPHPGLARRKGHLGFMGHDAHVEFRNIWLKEIPQ